MEHQKFDANEVIAGFPLVSIKHAISHVGIMARRNDIQNVAETLSCTLDQAERVLAAMEARGLITKGSKRAQWDRTEIGYDLAIRWQPPRKIEPVIDREPEDGVVNQVFDLVPCSILRFDDNDESAFEEAGIEVGVFVEYESSRVVEISLLQPDDYERPEESSRIESTIYLDVNGAKSFAVALQTAIEHAEREIARRATVKPQARSQRRTRSTSKQAKKPASSNHSNTAVPVTEASNSRVLPSEDSARSNKGTTQDKKNRSSLARTLEELRRGR